MTSDKYNVDRLDATGRAIISSARQPNVADVLRSPKDHIRLIMDFGIAEKCQREDEVIVELGPGQFLFPRVLDLKASQYLALDSDPVVVALGNHLGYRVRQLDLRRTNWNEVMKPVHGIFCKFSFNAFWFKSGYALRNSLDELLSRMDSGGWGWFAPWNGGSALESWHQGEQVERLGVMKDCFVEHEWQQIVLDSKDIQRYGLGSRMSETTIYIKNLYGPRCVS